eukprot:13797865-Ditylum_brightwellii.AAC.1
MPKAQNFELRENSLNDNHPLFCSGTDPGLWLGDEHDSAVSEEFEVNDALLDICHMLFQGIIHLVHSSTALRWWGTSAQMISPCPACSLGCAFQTKNAPYCKMHT